MSNKWLILGLLIYTAAPLNAEPFSGRVVDEQGDGLQGVTVSVYDGESDRTLDLATTGADGSWTHEFPNQAPRTLVFSKTGFVHEQLLKHSPASDIAITLRAAVKSSASLREERYVEDGCASISIPDDPEWNASFQIRPLKGDLAPDKKTTRRDPSSVIQVDGVYYVWYSYSLTDDPQKIAPWDLNDLYYATSNDGITWKEKGLAVGRGANGSFDHRSVFTTEVLAHGGKYYLVYQAAEGIDGVYNRNTVAMSRASSPDGPWEKLPAPVLTPTYTEQPYFDNNAVHDPCIIPYRDRFYLYYKGECSCRDAADCKPWCNPVCGLEKQVKWGVAIADAPEGPYVKSAANPVTNTGHEVMAWAFAEGVAILQHKDGPEPNSIQHSADGLNFEIKGQVSNIPEAAGLFRAPKSMDDPHAGIAWGVGHKLMWNAGPKGWMYIYRFDLVKR